MALVTKGVVIGVVRENVLRQICPEIQDSHLVSTRVMQAAHLGGRVQELLEEINKHLERHHNNGDVVDVDEAHHTASAPGAGAAKEDDLVLPPTHQLLHRLPEKIFAAQWPQQLSNDFIGFGLHSLL